MNLSNLSFKKNRYGELRMPRYIKSHGEKQLTSTRHNRFIELFKIPTVSQVYVLTARDI